MLIQSLTRYKPERWAISRDVLPFDVREMWRDCSLALPFWDAQSKVAEDISGNALHATLGSSVNSVTDWVAEEYGGAIRFANADGNDQLTIPDPAANCLDGFTEFSVLVLVKPNVVTAGLKQGLIGKYNPSAGARSWRLYLVGDEIELQISTDGSGNEIKATTTANLAAGVWHQIVITFKSGMYHVYVGGVDRTPGNFAGTTIFGGSDQVRIGNRSDGTGLDGYLADIRLWTRELQKTEVDRLLLNPWEMYDPGIYLAPSPAMAFQAGGQPAGNWIFFATVPKGTTTKDITPLTGGVSYDVRGRTRDFSNNLSAGSTPVSGTPLSAPPPLPPPPATGFYVSVGGTEYTSFVVDGSVDIELAVNTRSSAQIAIRDINKNLTFTPGQAVAIASEGDRLFGGIISSRRLILPGSADIERIWELDCADYSQLADRFLVAQVFTQMYAGDIVKSLINTPTLGEESLAQEGITFGTIEQGIFFEKVVFNYQKLSQCLTELAKASGNVWWIDPEKKANFCACGAVKATWQINDANKNFERMIVHETLEEYRNRQYLRAGVQISEAATTETFQGDGITSSGTLQGSRTFSVKRDVGKEPTVKVNGTTKTVGILDVDTGKDWYWQKGSNVITQDTAGTILKSADEPGGPDILEVTYFGLLPSNVRADAQDEIAARKAVEGGTGVYEEIRDDQRIEDFKQAIDVAGAELQQYGRLTPEVEVDTTFNYVKQGQAQGIQLADYGLDGEFLITSSRIRDISPGVSNLKFRCSYRAYGGPQRGDPIDFWRRLAESGRKFTIRENEVVNRIVETRDQVRLSDSLASTTQTNSLGDWRLDPYSVLLAGSGLSGKGVAGQVTNAT